MTLLEPNNILDLLIIMTWQSQRSQQESTDTEDTVLNN